MSEEGTTLMSRTLEVLDAKLNYLSGGNRGRKRKHTVEGAKSSQPEVLKDPIQVKRKGASKTSTKEKQSQNWRRMGGKNNSPRRPDRSSFRNELEEHTQARLSTGHVMLLGEMKLLTMSLKQ
ncbi:hypothetical protein C1H46_013804 [Malus baccata]|uniref:Uncharacterized protein n=1 Tax=Malus baccata TaxID=106549 RepID=A0A540MQB1_MALBA|nr:hypothetical protein C1H46_013804 [Malus baccata]